MEDQGGVLFRLWAPAARKVELLLTNRAALRIQVLDANGTVLAARDLYRSVKTHVRDTVELKTEKIVPATTVVLGDTRAEAEERARAIRFQQVSPATTGPSADDSCSVT